MSDTCIDFWKASKNLIISFTSSKKISDLSKEKDIRLKESLVDFNIYIVAIDEININTKKNWP